MSTENIDDLFRRQLGDHATPPGDDLWARLQAGPDAAAIAPPERVDELYKERLQTHATPPPREIWERLEDEHLRPRQRRAAAWWPMALAAAVALLLLAGGAGLWRGGVGGIGSGGAVVSRSGNGQPAAPKPANAAGPFRNGGSGSSKAGASEQNQLALTATATTATSTTSHSVGQSSETPISGPGQKNLAARATRPAGPASSASKVGVMAQQSPRRQQRASRQPDAAVANPAPLVAHTTASRLTPTQFQPADEPAPAVATSQLPVPASAEEIVPATTSSPAALAATLITVDVRNGAARRPSLATAVATAAAATEERPGLGGRLLRQVGHAVRGERLSLAEVTGLPENLTLEANIGNRRVSKSIQL